MTKLDGQTIVFAGGKTGGHLFPGLAVADVLRDQGCSVSFIGSAGGLESMVLPETPYPLDFISVGGLKGKRLSQTVMNLSRLPFALAQSVRILGKRRASMVVSLGGYAAGPAALAARLTGRGVAVMEQNTIPGITNRIIGKFAHSICLTFPDTEGCFSPDRTVLTGNPVRRDIYETPPADIQTEKPVCAVFGGSQGAVPLNALVMDVLKDDPELAESIFMVHQTGTRDSDRVREFYKTKGIDSVAADFFRDIGALYKRADLIICRAGATTIAELLSLGKYAVYIPFPHAADNHQFYNARAVEKQDMGITVEQNENDAVRRLTEIMRRLLEDCSTYERTAEDDVRPAAEAVADEVLRITEGDL